MIHELEFTDTQARPATWRARCQMPDVPLEETTSVARNITCRACLMTQVLEDAMSVVSNVCWGNADDPRVLSTAIRCKQEYHERLEN